MVVSRVLAKQCKSVSQLLQLHAQAVIIPCIFQSIAPHLLHYLSRLLPANSLVSAYPTFLLGYGSALFSCITYPNAYSFNSIVRIHVHLSAPLQAFQFFLSMRRLSIPPDFHSFPFILKAASSFSQPDVTVPRAIHAQLFHFGFLDDLYVINSQLHCYCVCGAIEDALKLFYSCSVRDVVTYNSTIHGLLKAGALVSARQLFDSMPVRDSVSWATLMCGYLQCNHCEEVIALFDMMMKTKKKSENVALIATLSACARLGKVDKGKEVHKYVEKKSILLDPFLSTGLIDFYAKSGFIEDALKVFHASRLKSLYTWNAIFIGLAMHGHAKLLLAYFTKMINSGTKPDGVSFLAALVACSHGGFTDEGKKLFNDMESVYGVPKEAKHYGCMVDMLARAGMIEEAIELVNKLPLGDDFYIWSGILAACRIHGNTELAEIAALKVMKLKPKDSGVYSLLSNVYACSGRWEDVVKIRRSGSEKEEVIKEIAYSLIFIDGVAHRFLSWDCFHPQKRDLLLVMNRMKMHMIEVL